VKIAFVGNFSQPHCSEVHWANTFEMLGHEVTRIQENKLRHRQLGRMVRGHDLFFWVRTWAGYVKQQDLDIIRAMGIPSVNYHLDLFIGIQRQDSLDTDPRWRTDFVFTADGDPLSQRIFSTKDIHHYYMPPGIYEPEAKRGNFRPEWNYGVVFVGGTIGYHTEDWPYRMQLVNFLEKTFKKDFKIFGHPYKTVRNQDLNDLYASALIAVGDTLCQDFTHERYFSDRLFETVGRGGFIIHPYIEGIRDLFTEDELVTYTYGDFNELKHKINYYLEHDDEREKIRRAGHRRALKDHTYTKRLQQMLDIVYEK
jgi:Glycosyl transferases group 1